MGPLCARLGRAAAATASWNIHGACKRTVADQGNNGVQMFSGQDEHQVGAAGLAARYRVLPRKRLRERVSACMRRVDGELGRRAAVKAVEETNKSFVCPLSHVLMRDPFVAIDGYSCERASIDERIRLEQAGSRTPRCPSNHLPLANTSLTPDRTLKSMICEAVVDLELGWGKRARDGAEGRGKGGEAVLPVSRPTRHWEQ